MIIKGCDEKAANACLEMRCAYTEIKQDSYDEVISCEEFSDVVDDDTLKEAAKHSANAEDAQTSYRHMQRKVLEKVKAFAEEEKKEKESSGSGGAGIAGGEAEAVPRKRLSNKTSNILPVGPAEDDINNRYAKEQVQALAPDGSKVDKDYYNGRWQIWYRLQGPPPGPWRSVSRSWTIRSS